MYDDNMQMQSLRTQEDVRLNFGIFIAHFRHKLYPLLTDFTITILYYMKTAECVKFPIILSQPVYETYRSSAYTDSVSATYA